MKSQKKDEIVALLTRARYLNRQTRLIKHTNSAHGEGKKKKSHGPIGITIPYFNSNYKKYRDTQMTPTTCVEITKLRISTKGFLNLWNAASPLST